MARGGSIQRLINELDNLRTECAAGESSLRRPLQDRKQHQRQRDATLLTRPLSETSNLSLQSEGPDVGTQNVEQLLDCLPSSSSESQYLRGFQKNSAPQQDTCRLQLVNVEVQSGNPAEASFRPPRLISGSESPNGCGRSSSGGRVRTSLQDTCTTIHPDDLEFDEDNLDTIDRESSKASSRLFSNTTFIGNLLQPKQERIQYLENQVRQLQGQLEQIGDSCAPSWS